MGYYRGAAHFFLNESSLERVAMRYGAASRSLCGVHARAFLNLKLLSVSIEEFSHSEANWLP
jgi:hypothetical protein